MADIDWDAMQRRWYAKWDEPAHTRWIPRNSGEAAIYSVEYLTEKEGNANGAEPDAWRSFAP